jgi:SAM-dependent methyltransferase
MAELSEAKQQARAMWAMGDYPSIDYRLIGAGNDAVQAAAVSEGQSVLDVACGAGNATIPAAKTGARVTGLDITPELLDPGRAKAAEAGVEIDWVEGDAEQLPFDDGSFDAVISVFGCMFAPDQAKTADEIARVMKPGGGMGICAWTLDGSIGKFFMTVSKHMPPPPEGFQPPILWGNEDHVRGLFDGTGVDLELRRAALEFIADSADAFMEEYETALPPMVAARQALEPEGKWEALRSDVLALYAETNEANDGSYRQIAEYLVIEGRKGA